MMCGPSTGKKSKSKPVRPPTPKPQSKEEAEDVPPLLRTQTSEGPDAHVSSFGRTIDVLVSLRFLHPKVLLLWLCQYIRVTQELDKGFSHMTPPSLSLESSSIIEDFTIPTFFEDPPEPSTAPIEEDNVDIAPLLITDDHDSLEDVNLVSMKPFKSLNDKLNVLLQYQSAYRPPSKAKEMTIQYFTYQLKDTEIHFSHKVETRATSLENLVNDKL
ncbi:hypothetical protein L2E82_22685 [Cichorium intybus]|uniref:Uncharacterized protein n=1 Tax=Cichorium intybus TaxID=13427 RepID=A0ACB9DYQ3_CICIN|nr:hypothetical protein L2E82_22685 [Cichorium intybus]